MVFPDIVRTDMDSAGYSEPIYPYLNRSARESSSRVRELIEKWFSHFPPEAQIELLPRLQSKDDQVIISAFFELYSYKLLCHLGYSPKIHPTLKNDSSKTPDFFVQGNNEEFITESVITNEQPRDVSDGQAFLDEAFDKINEIQSKDFFVGIVIRGKATSPLRSSLIKSEVKDFVESLDYQEIKKLYYSENRKQLLPKKTILNNGVKLIISPIPKTINSGKPTRLIGSWLTGFNKISTKEAIRKAIKRKTSRYGVMDIPYLLTVNVLSKTCQQDDVIEALFGTEQYIIDFEDPNAIPIPTRIKDGMWSSQKGTRLSGIIVVKELTPWTIAQRSATLYLNPWASYPYTGCLRQLPHVMINDEGRICSYDGSSMQSIFGLPDNWPETK